MKRVVLAMLVLAVAASFAEASVGDRIAAGLRAAGLSPQAAVFVVAMVPIVELRGAVPIGNNLFRLPLWQTLVLSIAGNMLPIFLVVLLIERIVALLSRVSSFKRFFDWLYERTRRRSGLIQRYEFWGLVAFIGIPLPGTGAWTGSLAAVLLGMSYWRSLLACSVGVLIAAGIVTALSVLGVWGAVIAVAVLLAFAVQAVLRRRGTRPA
ncbi:MAG: small multi-drug export protein [bacterium]